MQNWAVKITGLMRTMEFRGTIVKYAISSKSFKNIEKHSRAVLYRNTAIGLAFYLEKTPEVCLWKYLSEGLQFLSYCEVEEGGLPEVRRKVVTSGVDECGSGHVW